MAAPDLESRLARPHFIQENAPRVPGSPGAVDEPGFAAGEAPDDAGWIEGTVTGE